MSALWPLPGDRARWSLELEAPEVSAEDRFKSRLTTMVGERYFPHLDEARLRQLVRDRAPWFEPELRELGWSIEVRFERRLAASFGQDRVWLAGDAAHLTGPAGMQSMNAGLDEASDLARRIARVLRGGEGLDLLEAYGTERRAAWRFLLGRREGCGPAPRPCPSWRGTRRACCPASPPPARSWAPSAEQLGLAVGSRLRRRTRAPG